MTNANVQAKLENASYIATAADIEALTKERLSAVATSSRTGMTYLRSVIATTLAKLGITPRQRQQGHPTKLKPEEITVQLTALEEVHTDFYAAVLKAIDETPLADDEKPKTGRTSANAIKTRRATFARSAMSTIRSWVKAGKDLASVAPAKVTKSSLQVHSGARRRQRAVSPKRLITRAERQSKELIKTLLELTDLDKDAGLKEFQLTMNIMSDQLVKMGMGATRDAAQAVAEHRPLRIKGTVFVPTATSVLKQQARPS